VVLIAAIGERIQDVGVNDDHKFNRLPAEAFSQQLIGSPGHIGPAAVTDPDERRQRAGSPAVRKLTSKWLKQPQGTRSLLLAEPGDKLLQLLLGCHRFSLPRSTGYLAGRREPFDTAGTATGPAPYPGAHANVTAILSMSAATQNTKSA
jgi:hypothetical protein